MREIVSYIREGGLCWGDFVDKRLVLSAIWACLPRKATWTSVDSVVLHVDRSASTCSIFGLREYRARVGPLYPASSDRRDIFLYPPVLRLLSLSLDF